MGIDQVTLGQLFSYGRDLAVAGTVISVGWKIRGGWEEIRRFIERITEHMEKVEGGMQVLLDNHLIHMQDTLDRIADAEVSANKRPR